MAGCREEDSDGDSRKWGGKAAAGPSVAHKQRHERSVRCTERVGRTGRERRRIALRLWDGTEAQGKMATRQSRAHSNTLSADGDGGAHGKRGGASAVSSGPRPRSRNRAWSPRPGNGGAHISRPSK